MAYGIALPKTGDVDDNAKQWGAAQHFVTDDIMAAQRDLGRKLTPDEVTHRIDRLFMHNINFKNTFMGINTSNSQVSMMTMKPDDIPSSDADAIKASFAKHGLSNPTNDQILRAYWKSHAK
jgi:hypothetical protein